MSISKKNKKSSENNKNRVPSVVVIGGGTGTYTVLSALRDYPLDLSAIVTMADNGGSTGVLRDEWGALPPGDLRQCLVALSHAPQVMRKLFNHRFDRGTFKGHSFGNLFLSTLEQVTGSLDEALLLAGDMLHIRGKVIPVTLESANLLVHLKNGKVLHGEHELSTYQLLSRFGVASMVLAPRVRANTKAIKTILDADVILFSPGNLYASLIPNLLVSGIPEALRKARGKKVYIANLMNKHGHTDHFEVADYVETIEEYAGGKLFDIVLHNTKVPERALLRRYADEGEPVPFSKDRRIAGRTVIGKDLLSRTIHSPAKHDLLLRTLIRHDKKKLGVALWDIVNNK